MERARCDARVLGDLTAAHPERAVSSVTPRMREQILAAFGGRCAVPGCRSSRCLEIHHIIPQAVGGPHEIWNLVPLCDGHHVADHLGLLKITGRAPFDLAFEWMSPPIEPVSLPPELAMVVDHDVPAGTPGLDPAMRKIEPARCSSWDRSQRWAAVVDRVLARADADAPRRDEDVPAGTRDSAPSSIRASYRR